MKRLFSLFAFILAICVSSCSKFDDTDIWDKLNDHEKRIVKLEELCKQMNTNITALQTLVEALEKRDYITNVSPVREVGEIIGYTISFANSDTITIYHGKDGKDGIDGSNGKDGYTPQIGVMKDTDGIYYWTLDGEWLLDVNGNKIKAVGEDGRDGQDGTNGSDGNDGKDGQDGTNGTDGKDGVTPQLKIENDYWYVSYDNGATWVQLGKATGEDGKDGQDGNDGADGSDGADGEDGDSIFKSVTQDDEYVYFNLSDGTMITLPKHEKENIQFEDLQVKAICCKNWDTNNDGELSYTEAAAVKSIGTKFKSSGIIAFTELKYFTGINIIPKGAFMNCSSLWKISIPQSVLHLEEGDEYSPNYGCFSGCTSLTNVLLPDKLMTIGTRSFEKCTSLQQIVLPRTVTRIGIHAFDGCVKLQDIVIPDNVAIIDKGAFDGCSGLKKMIIGNGVAEFGWGVFYDCVCNELICNSSIRDVTYESGSGVFYGGSFDKVTFGGRCTKIGSQAFIPRTNGSELIGKVVTVVLNESVAIIGEKAFDANTLDYVYCKSTIPPQGSTNMFYSNLEKIYVPIGCAKTYKSASYWKNYASKIEEYDFENNPI